MSAAQSVQAPQLHIYKTARSLDLARSCGDRLKRDGFTAVEDITDAEDIQFIRSHIDRMIAQKTVKQEWLHDLGDTGTVTAQTQAQAQILEINHVTEVNPDLMESRFFQNARDLSRTIIGKSANLIFDHCIIKPAHSQTVTAWHQDSAYAGRITFTGQRLHWWLPLQAVNVENSCMQFVAGSHKSATQPHRPRSENAYAKMTDVPAGATVTALPLPVGNASIHLLNTLHFTGPNNSDAPRYAWVVQFGIKSRWRPRLVR